MTRRSILCLALIGIVTSTTGSVFACGGSGGYSRGYSSYGHSCYRPAPRVVYSHPSYRPTYQPTYTSSRPYYQPQRVSQPVTQPTFTQTRPTFRPQQNFSRPSGGFVSGGSNFSRPGGGGFSNGGFSGGISNPGRSSGNEQLKFDAKTGTLQAFDGNGRFLGNRRP